MSDVNGEPEGDQPGVPEDVPTGARGSLSKVVRDWLIVIGVALVAALLVRTYVLQQFYISGPSMETTMYTNDRVLVNKLSYRFGSIDRGDVVVFDRHHERQHRRPRRSHQAGHRARR